MAGFRSLVHASIDYSIPRPYAWIYDDWRNWFLLRSQVWSYIHLLDEHFSELLNFNYIHVFFKRRTVLVHYVF